MKAAQRAAQTAHHLGNRWADPTVDYSAGLMAAQMADLMVRCSAHSTADN